MERRADGSRALTSDESHVRPLLSVPATANYGTLFVLLAQQHSQVSGPQHESLLFVSYISTYTEAVARYDQNAVTALQRFHNGIPANDLVLLVLCDCSSSTYYVIYLFRPR